jgi:uncharacterized protein YacL
MNTNRLIWLATTLLGALVGAILGWGLGLIYVAAFEQPNSPLLTDKPLGSAVVWAIALGMGVVGARAGSWAGERFVAPAAARFHEMSVADRVLSIGGALLGLIFGVLATWPLGSLPNRALVLPIQLSAMVICAVVGMALIGGLRAEMLRLFPQLDASGASNSSPIGARPKLLDTNIIIDGRMADVCKTGFIDGPLLVPDFVLGEVQYIADSADAMRRGRGRRGLEVLNHMRELSVPRHDPNRHSAHASGHASHPAAEDVPLVSVLNDIPASVRKVETVDAKLVALAKELDAVIITNDFNLNRVAGVQGVTVLNVNELVQALKPVVLPGEEMSLILIKEGKEAGQGVGYLEDGTMVVVGDGSRFIGETCRVVISSVYQTVAGKMIFADLKAPKGPGDDLFNEPSHTSHSHQGHGQQSSRKRR